ncbi:MULTISPECIES: NAD-dependent epimerase/dehydratase family protein [Alphaproteobacteria]|jgi:nucleoside-diphosphate-sugar epimerase|uniref:NAD-dependent epimerase/dehydratase family protein n=6 Tax=Pseudomonadota TaxID=1224 RepID=A0A7C9RIM7_9BRAD|nr:MULTISPECIES: NAD-dependent epimerase/dehydratase family protein [Alphaproteobacteria]MCP4735317.1 NAD-dependent epimerase/dehydratase family protein [Bosea sp. (in: a-proteobacteria)]NGX98425.1 NAD-dependent epimerase/dehydratase family protein [Candidatus Afipia apatlaquensis]MBN8809528.1 NAD-dependent epimerase/dehydratase family protein [Sphingomonas sp.]MBR1036996.1 NAD-dependent epimerase/dehydratase family protein [Bradyrhizobium viridifuturi]MBR1074729.1 NAD-dependent epimerase/dehy
MNSHDLHVVIGQGPVGKAVVSSLLLQGARVRTVTRSSRSARHAGVEVHVGDVSRREDAISACAGATVVYQCAAPPYQSWSMMFPKLQASVLEGSARAGAVLVAAENLYGYGVAGTLDENLPLIATTRKGKVRADLSRQLIEAHQRGDVRTVTGRAADFLGPGVRQSAFGERVWPNLLKGKAIGWFGNADMLHSVTYVPDFAQALIRLGREERAWGRAWHVPSPPALTPREILTRAAEIANAPAPKICRVPRFVLRTIGLFAPAASEVIEMAYSYEAPFIISDKAYTETFGVRATDWDDALTATLESWQNAS